MARQSDGEIKRVIRHRLNRHDTCNAITIDVIDAQRLTAGG